MAEQPKKNKGGFDFVDPLFSIALAFGVSEGAFKSNWFTDLKAGNFSDISFDLGFVVNLVFLSTAFMILVTSWVHYHRSIAVNPIEKNSRFYADILMVWLYMFLLIFYNQPKIFVALVALVYLLYVIWDVLAIMERPKKFGFVQNQPSGLEATKNLLKNAGQLWFSNIKLSLNLTHYTNDEGINHYKSDEVNYMKNRSAISFSWLMFFIPLSFYLWLKPLPPVLYLITGFLMFFSALMYRKDKIRQFTPQFRLLIILVLFLAYWQLPKILV